MIRSTVAILLSSICITSAQAGASNIIAPGAERLNRAFAVFDSKASPGCAYVIRQSGRQIASGSAGMADVGAARAVTPLLKMDIGSVSKSFTAAAILTLADRGKINLADTLSNYFDDLPAWSKTVTIADLVYMRSGLPDFLVRGSDGQRVDNSEGADALFGSTKGFDQRVDLEEIYSAIQATKQTDFAAGSRYAYSNANYILLRMIVEKASGRRLDAYINRSVNIGKGSHPRSQRWTVSGISKVSPALGYKRDARTNDWALRPELWDVVGPSGVWVSADGLARWGEQLLADNGLPAKMTTVGAPRMVDGELRGYAAGLMTRNVSDQTIAYHLGATDGFTAGLFILPKQKQSLAFTCNLNSDDLIAAIASGEGAKSLETYQEMFILRTWLGE